MIPLLIMACLVWFVVQCSAEKPRRKWASRFDSPLGQKVSRDLVYIGRRIRAFVLYRRHRGTEWDITEVL